MPKDLKKGLTTNNKEQDNFIDEEDSSEYEDEDEQEYAYKCDFQKIAPPNRTANTSLLSDLFSNSPIPIQSSTKSDFNSQSKPINIGGGKVAPMADPLSESLKKNVEWEHAQSPLEKYRHSKKNTNSSESLNDNFSKW